MEKRQVTLNGQAAETVSRIARAKGVTQTQVMASALIVYECLLIATEGGKQAVVRVGGAYYAVAGARYRRLMR